MSALAPRTLHQFATVSMDTWVNVQIVSSAPREALDAPVARALAWFDSVERICTRFDPNSEVMRLTSQVGKPVKVSTLLFEVAAFALDLAALTHGVFDPTVGALLESKGINRNYRTLDVVRSGVDERAGSYRDVRIDRRARTLTLRRPLVLDLNSVAKGLAIDLAAQDLADYPDVCVEAGGDLYARGKNALGEPWHVGIQHPRAEGLLAQTLHITDAAVCTSGDYERHAESGEGHIVDGRRRESVSDLASVTVIAPTALAADGLSTAAMALGRERGLALLESQQVNGLLLTADGTAYTTSGGVE